MFQTTNQMVIRWALDDEYIEIHWVDRQWFKTVMNWWFNDERKQELVTEVASKGW